VIQLHVKDGNRKFWVLHAQKLDAKEVRGYRFGMVKSPPPKRRAEGFIAQENEPWNNLILSELVWLSSRQWFKFQLLPWVGNHLTSVSLSQIVGQLGILHDDEIRFIAPYIVSAFETLHKRFSRILGRITLKKLLFQPDGKIFLICTDVVSPQKESTSTYTISKNLLAYFMHLE
jgi:hypothetical protein